MRANWNYPTTVRFGAGRLAELATECRALGMRRPLLVTDPGLRGLPFVKEAVAANEASGLPTAVFSDVRPNPVGANVEAGVAAFRAGGHDGVIALGGGSALDVGKAVALMAGQDRPLWDFEDREDWWTRANADAIASIVAVPTTSGTGSEVGRCSVVVDESSHRKVILFHPRLQPARVIADPAVTLGLPPKLTAGTGMDAFAHNLEAYLAPGFHPLADGIAVEGIRLVRTSLSRAVADGTDLDARSDMMAASIAGATAFQKGLGAIHSLSHPVGAHFDCHHGTTNGVVMPYVLVFNRPSIENRIRRLALYIGLEGTFDAFLAWVLALRNEIGIPHTLAQLGVREEHVDALVPEALADPSTPTNPAPIDAQGMDRLFRAAIRGEA